MLKKIKNRSLYFEQELIWENFFINGKTHIQSIKIYKEVGERGCSASKRIGIYILDYLTEEVEMQIIPE